MVQNGYFPTLADSVTPKNLSPLNPPLFPMHSAEVEPSQTLPQDAEENRDKGGGSNNYVEGAAAKVEIEDVPTPVI